MDPPHFWVPCYFPEGYGLTVAGSLIDMRALLSAFSHKSLMLTGVLDVCVCVCACVGTDSSKKPNDIRT